MTEREWLDIFASNLTYLLNETGMSQRDLAERAGLSEATVSNYIGKRQYPGIKAITNIAHVFGVSVDDLSDFGSMIR